MNKFTENDSINISFQHRSTDYRACDCYADETSSNRETL